MVNGKKDMGDILATISRDDGDTWEEPVAIFDHRQRQGAIQFAYANPVLYRAPGQDIVWCFAMRCPIAFENSEESQLVAAFSADGGRTWTPVELAMHYTGPLITNAGIVETEIEGRKLFLLPAHRNTLQNDPRGSRDHFILSSTSLLEWKIEAYIPQPTVARVFLHEGNMARGDAPGELKIVMRTANYDDSSLTTDPPRAYSSVSMDGGHTGASPMRSRIYTTPSPRPSSAGPPTARTFTSTTTDQLNENPAEEWLFATRPWHREARGANSRPSMTRVSRTRIRH